MEQFDLNTPQEGFVDITFKVREIIGRSNVTQGICQIFIPHTTAAVTINENADPDVVTDMLAALDKLVPNIPYRHLEGNSPAHLKSSLMGCTIAIPIINKDLLLGTWQGVYFCEFDGPRKRKVLVQLIGS